MPSDWIPVVDRLPDEGVVVHTKINDGGGCRNEAKLRLRGGLWFTPDCPIPVCHQPTHWRYAVDAARVEIGRPEVVCLCGSTRFYEAFQQANYELTMQGKIVLSVGFFPHSSKQAHGGQIGCTAKQKAALDELYKRKIDLADSVYVLNVGGYIGDSTRNEIDYAQGTGKPIQYLETLAAEAAGGSDEQRGLSPWFCPLNG